VGVRGEVSYKYGRRDFKCLDDENRFMIREEI
jgi:hypothetical protein